MRIRKRHSLLSLSSFSPVPSLSDPHLLSPSPVVQFPPPSPISDHPIPDASLLVKPYALVSPIHFILFTYFPLSLISFVFDSDFTDFYYIPPLPTAPSRSISDLSFRSYTHLFSVILQEQDGRAAPAETNASDSG